MCVLPHFKTTFPYIIIQGAADPALQHFVLVFTAIVEERVVVVNVSSAPAANTIIAIINISSSTGSNDKPGQAICRTITIYRKHGRSKQARQQRHTLVQSAPSA